MCGIVGIYNKKGLLEESKTLAFLNKSVESMRHRGPDSQKSIMINNYYGSGFARLAIRDLTENAMQPMISDCGNHVITFNGEIYNTDYLKTELSIYNIDFKTTSDTEILLYSIIHFGIEKTLHEIDGIFAFAYYNLIENTLVLARDRVGVKPLYYYYDKNILIYSSHYDQVVKNDFVNNREIDEISFSAYFNLGYVPSGFGFFKNSFLLPQGSYLIINSLSLKKDIVYFEYGNNNNKINDIENTIEKSVTDQLISDVPIGTFLSGGIDSSIVSYFANKKSKIKAFNIGFDEINFDESSIANAFANLNNINFNSILFDKIDINKILKQNIEAFTEPFSDYSSLPTLLLSKFTNEFVTVSLSGDGGDELFYGYQRNVKYGENVDLLLSSKVNKIWKIFLSKILRRPLKLSINEILFKTNDTLISSNYIPGLKKYGSKLIRKYHRNLYLDFLNNSKTKIKTKSTFFQLMRKYEIYYHLQRVLIKVDRASMFHSLEVRVPLLSNNLIDISKKYTFEDCLNNKKGKYPLRKIISNFDNGKLNNLPKKGFSIPLDQMINNKEADIISYYIRLKIPEIDEFLNYEYSLELLNKHLNKEGDYKSTSWLLWSIFTLKSWYKEHIDV